MPESVVAANTQDLAELAADRILTLVEKTMATGEPFSLALSGGSTPQGVYTLLAQPSYANRLDWKKVFIFWSDERCVPPDHPDSNYRMARETLLDHVPVPADNIFRIRGELEPTQAAEVYNRDLHQFFSGPGLPRFGLVLLGVGADGHTASLFPGSPALQEQDRWAVSVEHHTPPPPMVPRVTLTPIAINGAAEIIFLVSGAEKSKIVAQTLKGTGQPDQLPAQAIRPVNGEAYWMMDREAGRLVTSDQ